MKKFLGFVLLGFVEQHHHIHWATGRSWHPVFPGTHVTGLRNIPRIYFCPRSFIPTSSSIRLLYISRLKALAH